MARPKSALKLPAWNERLFEQVGVVRREEPAEVEQLRHRRLVDEGAGVPRLAAADDQHAQAEGRAGHAGQVLHHAEGVARRAGNEADLLLFDGDLGDLAALLGRAHHRLVGRRRRFLRMKYVTSVRRPSANDSSTEYVW